MGVAGAGDDTTALLDPASLNFLRELTPEAGDPGSGLFSAQLPV